MKWLRRLAYWIVEQDLKRLPPLSNFGMSSEGKPFLRIQFGPALKDYQVHIGEPFCKMVDDYLNSPIRELDRRK